MDEEYLYKDQHSFNNTILELKDMSNQTRIMIWACENSDEQTAQRFVLSLLKNKKNDILIGEIIGHLNQRIGDEYFEYRLIQLVLKGVFEIEGVPKAMRFYSVKLHEKYRS